MSLFHPFNRLKPFSLEEPEDFEKFYEDTHLNVFRYVMALCAGNQVEAEDITAEAFSRAWEKRRQFSGSSSAAAGWVITIARNLLIDLRRLQGAHLEDAAIDENLPEQGSRVEDMLVDDEQFKDVLNLLPSLPYPQGDMLVLRYGLGWQVKAIADHFCWEENTVSVNLRRAVIRLKKQLDDQQSPVKKGTR